MPVKTMREALTEAIHQEMERDETVFCIGEDVAGCNGSEGQVGSVGGVFGVTTGVYDKFGPLRFTPSKHPLNKYVRHTVRSRSRQSWRRNTCPPLKKLQRLSRRHSHEQHLPGSGAQMGHRNG